MPHFAQKQSALHKKSTGSSQPQHSAVSRKRQEVHPILNLQRTIGNQAVLRLLRKSQPNNQQEIHSPANVASKGARKECANILPMGGEVTNDSDTPWWVSGCTNSKREDFYLLRAGQNSDNVVDIEKGLDGDVDALWPNGKSIKNGDTGKVVSNGVFKIGHLRNANIEGDAKKGYVISDFTQYYTEGSFPPGWALPKGLK